MLDPLDREAVLANVGIKKSDYRVIVELSCISSAEELLAIKRAYQARYKHSLEEDVASYFSGDMRKASLFILFITRILLAVIRMHPNFENFHIAISCSCCFCWLVFTGTRLRSLIRNWCRPRLKSFTSVSKIRLITMMRS